MTTPTVTEVRNPTATLRVRQYHGHVHLITWLLHYPANPNKEG